MLITFGLFFITPQGQPLSITLNPPAYSSHFAACMPKRRGCVDDSGMAPSICNRPKGCRIDDSGMGPEPRVRIHTPLAPYVLDRR